MKLLNKKITIVINAFPVSPISLFRSWWAGGGYIDMMIKNIYSRLGGARPGKA